MTLVVKAPNQKIADQTIECALDWTVKKLKQHLSSVYPSKPTETQQRIIYSGQLLQDHLKLKDILRQYEPNQQTHTVHLVCSPSTTDSTPSQQTSSNLPSTYVNDTNFASEGLRQRHPHVSSATAEQQIPTSAADMTAPQAFNGGVPTAPLNPVMYPVMQPMMMPGGFPLAAAYSPEQMMWMQQYYAQYMAQYIQQYQQGFYGPQVGQPDTPTNQNAVDPPRGPPAAAANARVRQPEVVRMNAQGGPVIDDDDDDMPNRDWLDWIYMMIRFGILLCILYFYSTVGRFVATMGLVVLLYLYQVGWFRVHRRHQHQRQQQQQPNAPAAQQQQQPDNNVEQDTTPAGNAEDAVPEPPAPNALSVAWTFVITFFSSLAPQQPPPVNVN